VELAKQLFNQGGIVVLINKVILYSNDLTEMKNFYVDILGFEQLNSNELGFEIKVGESVLEIKQNKLNSHPFYHFAFNIPTDLFGEAKEWATKRVKLNKEDDENEAHFEYSKAEAFYFYDPSGNIVEFISRYAVSPKSKIKTFSAKNILNISEINITTNEVVSVAKKLIQFGIPIRNNETLEKDSLNFMGEMRGGSFLLLGPTQRRWIFSNKYSEIHPVSIEVDNHKVITLEGGELRVENRK
jgi:catechol 2,3-dioxygenase-like lactoylglutathione lyase family enzyme